jgi:hypothetical protein
MAANSGLTHYYQQKVEHLELTVRDETQNLRRLEAQRNELNSKGAPHAILCARGAPPPPRPGGM